ncbi:MAG: hypothetical protein JRN59_02560 [Nitrososphaerota archaeon]|nr:hypothetical protein [Nitrososphaerota archaeon]
MDVISPPKLKTIDTIVKPFQSLEILSTYTVLHSRMKGIWAAPEDDKNRELAKLLTPQMVLILKALRGKLDVGLSNAEIDSQLGAGSQWIVFWGLRELMALDIIEFDVHLFGEPGKYRLTQTGVSVAESL